VKAVALTMPSPPASLPPASAECVTTLQPAQPGAPAQQFNYKMARAGDGKMRMDYGPTSVITDPAAGKMMLLDHVKKEVQEVPLPKPPAAPEAPPAPAMPSAPPAPPPPPVPGMTVKDLGKRVVDGHEVEGKEYTMPPPPKAPTPPAPPQVKAPAAPGTPEAPKPPDPPPVPEPPPVVTEVWTSTQLLMPVLTRITGPFGKQISHNKNLKGGEPSPALFQAPPDYKPVK
jgi:hypothetical protein